jgi:hypothetical protein
MKNIFGFISLGLIFIFSGCTKDDFTWNAPKLPPKPCIVFFDYSEQNYIKKVSFSNMNNTTGGTSGYNYYSKKKIEIEPGQIYELNVEYNVNTNYDYVGVYGYFDWNCDGDFIDNQETVLISNNINLTNGIISVSVPIDAVKGSSYARFVVQPSFYAVQPDPCVQDYYGEAEDYPLLIK